MSRYVKVVYDFVTTEPGEVPLQKGDVVHVLETIDENWLYGSAYGREGTFPTNFVENIALPGLKPGQKLFAGIKDFVAQEHGDLGFKKGKYISLIIVWFNPIISIFPIKFKLSTVRIAE